VVNGERRDAVLGQLELFRALAEDNEREQQLGSLNVPLAAAKAARQPLTAGDMWAGRGARRRARGGERGR
jgi:hypothetical protein